MKLRQLVVFCAIAEEKSLRAAARKLNLTQPAVTRLTQELEAELGVQLMTRSTQGIELTKYGSALEARGIRVLEEVRRTQEEINQLKGDMCGKVKVGIMPTIAFSILPEAIRRFRKTAPEAELAFTEVSHPVPEGLLKDPSTDFIVGHIMPKLLDESLRRVPLFSTDFHVLVRKGHRLENARDAAELIDEEWVATNPTGTFRLLIESEGLPMPRRLIRCSSFAATLALVAGTDALGYFSEHLTPHVIGIGLHRVPLESPRPRLQMSIVLRRDLQLTPAAHHFMTCLREAANQPGPSPAQP